MNHVGPICREVDRGPSRREFWFSAFFAAFHRVGVEAALAEADRALVACNQRWQKAHVVSGFSYRDDYSVGDALGLSPENGEAHPA